MQYKMHSFRSILNRTILPIGIRLVLCRKKLIRVFLSVGCWVIRTGIIHIVYLMCP